MSDLAERERRSLEIAATDAEADARFVERLLDASDDCIKVLDLEARLVSMSINGQKALAIMDFASVEGALWLDFWSGRDRVAAEASVRAARAGDRGRFTGSFAVEGRERWWDVSVTPILDAAGNPEQLLAVSRDVTDMLVAQRELARSEERYRLLGESLPGTTWTATPDGRLDHVSTGPGAAQRSSSERLGDAWLDGIHPNDREPTRRRWAESIRSGEPYETQFRVRIHDGSYRWQLVRALPRRDAGGTIEQWIGVNVDIEEQHAAYERERAIAVRFQEASLPAMLPAVDGLALSADYRPGRTESTIGGDWYDAFALRDGRIAITIGDVLGKGLDAAVTMAKVRQAMRSAALLIPEPGAMLTAADGTVRDIDPATYATALAGIYDRCTGTFAFASAGHPGPVLRHADGAVDDLTSSGVLLGLRQSDAVEVVTVAVPRDAALVFYTDGVTEATRDIDAGERRLYDALRDPAVMAAPNPAFAIVERVLDGAAGTDDIAVLVAAMTPVSG